MAALRQQSVEPFKQAAQAYAAGNTEKGGRWKKVGGEFVSAAWYRDRGNIDRATQTLASAQELVREAERVVAKRDAVATSAEPPSAFSAASTVTVPPSTTKDSTSKGFFRSLFRK